tara:strand:+ start:2689 stop:4968 length:2280 start_codon:yes stop_codon:yes gene_type:complete
MSKTFEEMRKGNVDEISIKDLTKKVAQSTGTQGIQKAMGKSKDKTIADLAAMRKRLNAGVEHGATSNHPVNEYLTPAEKKLMAQMYDKKGNLTPLGKKVMDHGKKNEELDEMTSAQKNKFDKLYKKMHGGPEHKAMKQKINNPVKADDAFHALVKRKAMEGTDLDEAKSSYDIYHKDFSGAMQHAYASAKKNYGITVKSSEIDDKVASGPRKPSNGKTNTYRLKGDKGSIQVQVYNTGSKYELNMYKEEVEVLGEASKTIQSMMQIVDKKQAMKIDGVLVDMFTASAVTQIYNKINDANKAKMDKMKATQLANVAMKLLKKEDVQEATGSFEYYYSDGTGVVSAVGNKADMRKMNMKQAKAGQKGGNFSQNNKKYKVGDKIKEDLDEVSRSTVRTHFSARYNDKEVKMGIGIASNKKYANNMTGASKAIEKIKKGLSDHPQIKAVLKRMNENELTFKEMREMRQPFIVVDTARKNQVVAKASSEAGAKQSISSAERPPMSIKDKKTLKIVKSNKKQDVGYPMKEEMKSVVREISPDLYNKAVAGRKHKQDSAANSSAANSMRGNSAGAAKDKATSNKHGMKLAKMKAMGVNRAASSLRKESVEEAKSPEGTIRIIDLARQNNPEVRKHLNVAKAGNKGYQVQRMTKGVFTNQGKPYKSSKEAEKVRKTGQHSMQMEAAPKIDPQKMAAHMAKYNKPKKMTNTQKQLSSIRQRADKMARREDFTPHMMYDPKTGEAHKAEKEEDHLRMKKMGYTHDKPES